MSEVVATIREAIAAGRKISIYGDFDCDGVCATSILVGGIRELGGEVDWLIPDRISEGYGLNPEAIERLSQRGTSLVITVDCGVTAVEEVALARRLGLEIIVTDHHQPGPGLPDCPILHPIVSDYPFPLLCGAAVAAKLAAALRRDAGVPKERDEADLDLVALATVTDVMPLHGENRNLVRTGTMVARRARRIGLAALMADARVEPSRLDAGDFGFRLGPRINAAGRLRRADAGVELFLATSRSRADEIARELAGLNAERRRIEREVEAEAKAVLKAAGEPGPAVVVAGEGWHPGVVGIVASKLVKATGRPSVVISLEGENGRGSARSVPGLDLHAAISDAAPLLEQFGGHAAAAGLGIRADRVDRFREVLGRAVAERIGTEPAAPVIEFDAVAGGDELGFALAEELEKLEPFGNGNPAVKLLIPGARIENLTEMGEGKHCRFSVCSGSSRANGVSFGRTTFGLADGERTDVIAELGLNHWNGSIDPQLRVIEVRPPGLAGQPTGEPERLVACGPEEWWQRFEAAMSGQTGPFDDPSARGGGPALDHQAGAISLDLAAVTNGLPGVAIAGLISSGERLAVLSADAPRRWSGLGGPALGRFIPEAAGQGSVAGIWVGSPAAEVESAAGTRVLVTDYASLVGPRGLPLDGFDRIALLDPPYLARALEKLGEAERPVHLLAGPEEFSFSARVAAHRLDLTVQLRELYRNLREAGAIDGRTLEGEDLRDRLETDGKWLRSPEEAAGLMQVLGEAGLARSEGVGSARAAGVVSSEGTELSASAVFVRHFELYEEHQRFLSHFDKQTPKP